MRSRFLLALACCTLFFAACARQKKTSRTNSTTSTTAGNSPTAGTTAGSPQPAKPITAMTMRRSGCFGRCPTYLVELFADGRARYTGEMFTENVGTFEKNVGAAKVLALFRQFEAVRVDTCSPEYDMLISDLPGLRYTFTRGSEEQVINNASFGPRFLPGLAADVDSLVQVDRTWKKTAEPKKQD